MVRRKTLKYNEMMIKIYAIDITSPKALMVLLSLFIYCIATHETFVDILQFSYD